MALAPDCPPDLRIYDTNFRKALERLNLRASPGMAPFSLVSADSLPRNVPDTHTSALKGTLQDMIHGFYLEAIARLPAPVRWQPTSSL
jgi:hypothetical protein